MQTDAVLFQVLQHFSDAVFDLVFQQKGRLKTALIAQENNAACEHDIVNLGKRFQALFAADKNAVFGKRTGRSSLRGRGSERQGTRAGNDQQGNGNPQSSVRVGIPCPADKNRNRKQEFAKHETGRVFFGQLGGTRFLCQHAVE